MYRKEIYSIAIERYGFEQAQESLHNLYVLYYAISFTVVEIKEALVIYHQ